MEIKKILFPYDLSENALKIIPFVLSFSEVYKSTIYLLHVVDVLEKWGQVFIPYASMDAFEKKALEVAEDALGRVCEEHFRRYPNFQKRIVSGDPITEILTTIDSEGVDLVIMGTHGRKGLEHTIFGSVAENVVKKSPAPVLTINPYKLK
ncbi:MAG: hypothetical protein BA861_01270 [Desulfobacterales bacterium S3730MH5]|nr:MAG: hypothetical protein BA861_01270 [Desulfobacterales bacterium S3730MH5]